MQPGTYLLQQIARNGAKEPSPCLPRARIFACRRAEIEKKIGKTAKGLFRTVLPMFSIIIFYSHVFCNCICGAKIRECKKDKNKKGL